MDDQSHAHPSNESEYPITHGICKECRIMAEHETEKMSEFLDALNAPILLVNSEKLIESANQAALKILGTNIQRIKNRPGGNVISCVYSELPEGCGKTIHCSGCKIRLSVTHTMETGEPLYHQEAYELLRTPTGVQEYAVFITTEKVGQFVMLRVDKMEPKPATT